MANHSWTERVPTAELQQIHEWIDDEADYSATDIHRHLHLGERFNVHPRTFRRYVAARRGASRERIESGALSPSDCSPEDLEALTLSTLRKALLTQDIPGYALPRVLTGLARIVVAKYAADENRRREETHQRKLREMDEKLRKLAEPEGDQAAELTPEQVQKIRQKVFGL